MSFRTFAAAGAAALLVAGCGGGSSPSPTPPDVKGNYAGSWHFVIADETEAVLVDATCDCTFEIPNQSGNSFFGRSQAEAPCSTTIPLSNGFVSENGAIRFDLPTDFFGGQCTITDQPPLSGTYSGGRISVSRTERYDCTALDGHTYAATVSLDVSRN